MSNLALPPFPADLVVNSEYLNRTQNKDPRPKATNGAEFCVWHETESPNPHNPRGTLDYNLATGPVRGRRGSYTGLIAYDGTLYFYVDWRQWVAWHAGQSAARGYQDYAVSVHSLGWEVDSKGDGTPPSAAQWETMIAVIRWTAAYLHIPLDAEHHLEHRKIALPPGRKHDPAGYTVGELIERALTVPLAKGHS